MPMIFGESLVIRSTGALESSLTPGGNYQVSVDVLLEDALNAFSGVEWLLSGYLSWQDVGDGSNQLLTWSDNGSIPAGTHTFDFSLNGYQPGDITISISIGQSAGDPYEPYSAWSSRLAITCVRIT